jgi:hypothetical protein
LFCLFLKPTVPSLYSYLSDESCGPYQIVSIRHTMWHFAYLGFVPKINLCAIYIEWPCFLNHNWNTWFEKNMLGIVVWIFLFIHSTNIHSLCIYVPGSILSTWKTVVKQTYKNPCLFGTYIYFKVIIIYFMCI